MNGNQCWTLLHPVKNTTCQKSCCWHLSPKCTVPNTDADKLCPALLCSSAEWVRFYIHACYLWIVLRIGHLLQQPEEGGAFSKPQISRYVRYWQIQWFIVLIHNLQVLQHQDATEASLSTEACSTIYVDITAVNLTQSPQLLWQVTLKRLTCFDQ